MQNEPMTPSYSLVRFPRPTALPRILPYVKCVPDALQEFQHMNARSVSPWWDEVLRYKTNRGDYPQGNNDQRDIRPNVREDHKTGDQAGAVDIEARHMLPLVFYRLTMLGGKGLCKAASTLPPQPREVGGCEARSPQGEGKCWRVSAQCHPWPQSPGSASIGRSGGRIRPCRIVTRTMRSGSTL